jgi:hypothetical protein
MDKRITLLPSGEDCLVDFRCCDGWPLDGISDRYRLTIGIDIEPTCSPNGSLPRLWRYVVGDLDAGISSSSWDDSHIHFFTRSDLAWVVRRTGLSIVRTAALIDRLGLFRPLRAVLDAMSSGRPVQYFLSGSTMLVGYK